MFLQYVMINVFFVCNDHSFLQYVMINGKFDQPDDLPGRQMVEGKYTLAPLYHVKVRYYHTT